MMLLNPVTPRGGSAKRVAAVILDWAGTTIDFGSLAPVKTLQRVFEDAGISITEPEARRDMGIAKRDHIESILSSPRVLQAWEEKYGSRPGPADTTTLYERFIPLQFECLRQYSKLTPGTPEIVSTLRSRHIKIGSTTGYTRAMLDVLLDEAAEAGYEPDCSFCPEDVGAGRPQPFMIYAAALKMKVYPLSALIKVGDTESDIREGLNAGVWSVGVALTGNAIGLSEKELAELPQGERLNRTFEARRRLTAAGAHYVIDSLKELPAVLDDVEARLDGNSPA